MANNNINEITYEGIISAGTANPLMVQYERGKAAPIDISSTFGSIETLEKYAEGNLSYAGQVVSVVNSAKTDVYKIDYNSNIKKLLSENDLDIISADSHKHENKEILDNITLDKVNVWDAAEQNAKDYANGLASNYDVAGAAAKVKEWVEKQDYLTEHQDISKLATKEEVASALIEAKAYVDTISANTRLEALEAIDHDKLIADAIAEVVASADTSFDTLKEIADWILNDTTGAAKMANDIEDLKKEDEAIDGRLDALEAISGQSHVHDNKALLDTYTQTETDLADAVAKKHKHTNKDVLDDISSEKVAAWDAAEQNAKDYVNIEIKKIEDKIPSISGLASQEWVTTQIENIEISSGTPIDLSGYATSADVMTTKNITVTSGEWASAIKNVFGNIINSGLTFQVFLEKMVNVELYPKNYKPETKFNVYCNTPSLYVYDINNIRVNSNSNYEVGTKLILNAISVTDTIVDSHYIKTIGLEYGYKIGANGAYTDDTIYIQNLTPELVDSSTKLEAKFTGFTNSSGVVIGNETGSTGLNSKDLYVGSGSNIINISQSGKTYKTDSTTTIDTIYIASNMGNYTTYTPSVSYTAITATANTTLNLTGYIKTFYGTTNSTEDVSDKNIRTSLGLNSTKKTITSSDEIILESKLVNNHKRIIIACPNNLVLNSVIGINTNQNITGYLTLKNNNMEIPCANENIKFKYNIYDASWVDSFGDENWKITFKNK